MPKIKSCIAINSIDFSDNCAAINTSISRFRDIEKLLIEKHGSYE
jgi:hypothetical protein